VGELGIGMMEIRAMTPSDVPAVCELEQLVYPEPWSEKVFNDELAQPSRVYLLALDDGEVVGYAGLMVVFEDAHITTMSVAPAARGTGVGQRMMMELVDAALAAEAEHLTLEVRMSNDPAQALYRKFGFAPVGVRKDYYLKEDALIMWASGINEDDYQQRLARIREGM
jgi:ribosomal-protein-alanine N-acetyltransferase